MVSQYSRAAITQKWVTLIPWENKMKNTSTVRKLGVVFYFIKMLTLINKPIFSWFSLLFLFNFITCAFVILNTHHCECLYNHLHTYSPWINPFPIAGYLDCSLNFTWKKKKLARKPLFEDNILHISDHHVGIDGSENTKKVNVLNTYCQLAFLKSWKRRLAATMCGTINTASTPTIVYLNG